MNIDKYAALYARFHGSNKLSVVDNVIVIPYKNIQWIKSIVLKLQFFDKVFHESKRPLISAFKLHFKTDAIHTVFQENHSHSILLGNERVVFPDPDGDCRLCATPFFLKNPKIVPHYLDGITKTLYENVFLYKNSILYLDDCDVPSPNKSYFDEMEESDGTYRLCFLTTQPKHVIESLAKEWKTRPGVETDLFKTTHTTISISKFFYPSPVNDIYFPDNHITSTAMINKRISLGDSEFLVQDILNSYRNNGGTLQNVGVFIEYPIKVLFDGLSHRSNGPLKFLALAVNGQPDKVLYVKCPYDRYTEYDHIPSMRWSNFLYTDKIAPLDRVVVDKTILGYTHSSGAFLCLSYPMLHTSPVYCNLNMGSMLNTELDPTLDRDLDVVETYYLDSKKLLSKVKHKKMVQELWCLTTRDNPAKKYPKHISPPPLVEHWIRLTENNQGVNYGDLSIVKLAMLLGRHKICFTMRRSSKRQIVYEREKDIVFEMGDEAITFVNDLRLDTYKKMIEEEKSSDCNIM